MRTDNSGYVRLCACVSMYTSIDEFDGITFFKGTRVNDEQRRNRIKLNLKNRTDQRISVFAADMPED